MIRFILSFTILLPCLCSGQTAPAEDDTSAAVKSPLATYTLPEIVITATRWGVDARHLPSSATILTKPDLDARNGATLVSALDGVSGLFLKSYGGPGAVATPSMRGMGSEHTLVLIDGQRLNNVRDGQVDLGIALFPDVERIEVLRGGYSAIHGADALGGVINIVTRRPRGRRSAMVGLSGGSQSQNAQRLAAEFELGRLGVRLSAARDAGDGDFPFRYHGDGEAVTLRRVNSDFELRQLQALADYAFSDQLGARFTGIANSADRGSPGPVLSRESSGAARLRDNGLRAQFAVEWNAKPDAMVRVESSFSREERVYTDPGSFSGGDGLETSFRNGTIILSSTARLVYSTGGAVVGGFEFAHSRIQSNQVEDADRNQRSAFVSAEQILPLPFASPLSLSIYPSLRFDAYSDIPGETSPRLGVNLVLRQSPDVYLRTSYGKNFRAPSFFDLYWKPGGNPALRPERSWSFDAGVVIGADAVGNVEIEANYFDIDTRDRIVWTPGSGGLWSPRNLQRVRSKGLELSGSWKQIGNVATLRASYSISSATKLSSERSGDQTENKQLVYLPQETANISISLDLAPVVFNLLHTFTGFRYTTETNDPRFILPAFHKTDANITWEHLISKVLVKVRLEASNLFNTDYQLFPHYPMPLRSLRGAISCQI